jgi:hypothetical protein
MKQTVEEAAKEYSLQWAWNSQPDMWQSEKDFKAGAEWQAKQSPWISVEERLPEEDGYYVVTDGNFPTVAYFFKEWNRFSPCKSYPHLFFEEGVIKAYMPIPSFDQILEANKDVLQRIKEKGETK